MKYLISFIFMFLPLTSSAEEVKGNSDMLGLRTTVYMVNDIEKAKRRDQYEAGHNIRQKR